MSNLEKNLVVKMNNGENWRIPVSVVARHRAEHYSFEFGNDIQKSLVEDTIPLFETEDFEIEDWAKNNMNWDDVVGSAMLVSSVYDYQEAWLDSSVEVL